MYGLLGLEIDLVLQKFLDKFMKKNIRFGVRNLVQQQMYFMVYIFVEVDCLNGYVSGMLYVNYYDMIWSELFCKKSIVYNVMVVNLLFKFICVFCKGYEYVLISDVIEVYSMVQGFVVFWDKREGGVYELLDVVIVFFVKGEFILVIEKLL